MSSIGDIKNGGWKKNTPFCTMVKLCVLSTVTVCISVNSLTVFVSSSIPFAV